VGDRYDLRKCECRHDWLTLAADAPGKCRCRGVCPPFVTPAWLTLAERQGLCALNEATGFNCYADCERPEDPTVRWFAQPCGGETAEECHPQLLANAAAAASIKDEVAAETAAIEAAGKRGTRGGAAAVAEAEAAGKAPAKEPRAAAADKKAPPPPKKAAVAEEPAAAAGGGKAGAVTAAAAGDVVDLRGLQCELLDGKEQCFYEDAQGRELCPPFVTSTYLSAGADQYLCSAAMAHEYYCTVGCQEGNPEVRWGANEIKWCVANPGSCSARPAVIPRAEFKLKAWSAKPDPVLPCAASFAAGERAPVVPGVTFGMLTHEPRSMSDTLVTYDKLGLLAIAAEFLVYVNKRTPDIDAALTPYLAKYPRMRVMGDASNYGIARGITFLTGNATYPYFLFLERDFQLVEPATCVYEQLMAGRKLIEDGKAHVGRYRHRRKAGRPNWAERMFRGHEDDVFKGSQPNLFCNHYYWVPDPDVRWPDKMWICNKVRALCYCVCG